MGSPLQGYFPGVGLGLVLLLCRTFGAHLRPGSLHSGLAPWFPSSDLAIFQQSIDHRSLPSDSVVWLLMGASMEAACYATTL